MFVIGVTGGIGCGKSTLAALLGEASLPVIDADQISHEMTGPMGRSIPAIIEAFGPDIIAPDGSLSRKDISDLVFHDKKQLDLLSRIIHADVLDEIGLRLDELRKKKIKAAVLDVPIPVKNGFLDRCDQVWCIWTEEGLRLERLEARGMPRAEALRRMAVQMDREEYRQISTHFIENNGSLQELREKVQQLLKQELDARGIPYTPLV